MTRFAGLLVSLLLVATPAFGDGDEPVKEGQDLRPVLAKLFKTARESGAIKRVLGTRYYLEKHSDFSVLVTVKGSLVPPQGSKELRVEVELLTLGGMREESTSFTCDVTLTGEIRALDFKLVRGKGKIESSGAVRDGKLQLKVRSTTQGGEPTTEDKELSWGHDVLPFSLAVFVVPALSDQGLPETLTFRAFHHARLKANRSTSQLTVVKKGDVRTIRMTQFVLMQPAVSVTVGPRGALTEIRLAENDRLTEVSEEKAKSHLRTWKHSERE